MDWDWFGLIILGVMVFGIMFGSCDHRHGATEYQRYKLKNEIIASEIIQTKNYNVIEHLIRERTNPNVHETNREYVTILKSDDGHEIISNSRNLFELIGDSKDIDLEVREFRGFDIITHGDFVLIGDPILEAS